MGFPALEDVPNDNGGSTVAPPTAAPAPQLTPEDAQALEKIPGIDRDKLATIQQDVADRQPVAPEPQQLQAPAAPQAPIVNPLGIAGYLPGTASSTTSRVDLGAAGKEALKKQQEADATQLAALGQQEQVAQDKAKLQAETARVQAQAAHDNNTQLAGDIAAQHAAAKSATDQITSAMNDFRAAKIDPDHYWNSRSTGQKIGATIASALDVMGAAWSKSGRTPTHDAIQHAIERDIEGQKMAMDAKARGVQMAVTQYQVAREAGADDASAKAALRAAGNEEAVRMLDAQIKDKTLGPEQQAAYQALRGQLQEQAAQHAMTFAQTTAKHVSSSSSRTPITNAQMAAMQNGSAGGGGKDAPILAEDLAGQGWQVANPRLAQSVINKRGMTKEVLGRMNDAQASLEAQNQLIALRKKHGAEKWDQATVQAYEQYRETAIQKYAQSMGMPNTDATQKKLEGMFPDAAALTTNGVAGTVQGLAHGVGIGKDPVLARWEASRKESEVNFTNNLGIPGLKYVGKDAPTVVSEYPKGGKTYLQMSDGTWRVK